VPATTTVWCSKAETVWLAQVACRLHPWALSLASILILPARLKQRVGSGPAGPNQRGTGRSPSGCQLGLGVG